MKCRVAEESMSRPHVFTLNVRSILLSILMIHFVLLIHLQLMRSLAIFVLHVTFTILGIDSDHPIIILCWTGASKACNNETDPTNSTDHETVSAASVRLCCPRARVSIRPREGTPPRPLIGQQAEYWAVIGQYPGNLGLIFADH